MLLAPGLLAVAICATAGGALVGPTLSPAAAALLLGVALIVTGAGALWTPVAPAAPGIFAIMKAVATDRAMLITFALAARAAHPALAGAGAFAGALLLTAIATSSGARAWHRLPLRGAAIAGGAVMILFGAGVALSGLRII